MSGGLNAVQLLEEVIRPTLKCMGKAYCTVAAEQLVLGTAVKESGGLVWLRQLDGGPALGLWQMEPRTFRDLLTRCPNWMLREVAFVGDPLAVTPASVIWNLRMGAMMCRLKYRDAEEELPQRDDVKALASYWKRYYNSVLGKGKPEEFEHFWHEVIAPRADRMWPQ